MVRNSTLFYFYDDFTKENELYENEELILNGSLFSKELNFILNQLDYSPPEKVLERILNEV